MEDDEFHFPDRPTRKNVTDLPVKKEPLPFLETGYDPLQIEPDEVEDIIKDKTLRKVFASEMENCDIYFENIHKSFKFATSIDSVIRLVNTGMAINTHRRKLMQEASGVKSEGTSQQFDALGRPI
jgi:hypothetical protein